jgi:hypothetical protein
MRRGEVKRGEAGNREQGTGSTRHRDGVKMSSEGALVKRFALTLLLVTISAVAHAEVRWCSISSLGPGQNLIYPPIARAARVGGHVMERVIFTPGGGATSFEFISGPKMLSAALEEQMRRWTISTNAVGPDTCITLAVADFMLDENSGDSSEKPIDISIPSILQLHVSTTPVCLCDPAGTVSRAPFYRRTGDTILRAIRKLLGLRDRVETQTF